MASKQISRRGFLRLGAGVAAIGLAGSNFVLTRGSARGEMGGQPFVEPEVISSRGGLLETTLEARTVTHTLAGQTAVTPVYNGSYPGPTLRVHAGDTLRIRLINQLDGLTNIHVHGLHVSPRANSDNVLLHIHPGETFDYEFKLPADHPAGLYWYHPHFHGMTTQQISGGMLGAIVIEGDLDRVPGVAGLPERLLALQTTQLNADGTVTNILFRDPSKFIRTLNGQVNPTMTIQPGETQRWRIGNFSASHWFRLRLDGHSLHQIAKDGNTLGSLWTRDEILLAPAERVEVLVQGAAAGSYALRTTVFDNGFVAQAEDVLGTLVSQGEVQTPAPLPAALLPFDDLRNARIDHQRSLAFQILPSEQPGNANFEINSLHFDEHRVDFLVPLNSTEEWVISNATNVWHPFHIHINPFQVVSINGTPVAARGYEDTVAVPPGGEVRFRTRFLDFTGKYVLHCHVLPHEDGGMMSVVEVASDSGAAETEGTARFAGAAQNSLFACSIPTQ